MNSDGGKGRPDRRAVVAGAAALGLSRPLTASAAAPEFPVRPLRIMAPANPGGGWDQFARLMQLVIREDQLTRMAVEVVNRGGAGGTIGLAEFVTRHRGDGHMVMVSGGVMVGATIANRSAFHITDPVPLARMISEYMVVGVPASSPFRTMQDFIAAYRADPGSVSWCGGSAGGVDHILVGLITEAAGVPASAMRYVAYSGGGEASAAILGGQVTIGVNGFAEWVGLAASGRVRLLAVSGPERIGDKQTPTLRESGLDVSMENWRGVFAAPGIDAEQQAWWMSLLERLRDSPRWQEYLRRNTWGDTFLTGEDFRRFLVAEEEKTARTLARIGIGAGGGGHEIVGPWAFPTAIGVAGVAAAGAVAVEAARRRPGQVVVGTGEDDEETDGPPPEWKRFALGAALTLAYVAGLAFAGFLIATPLFIAALCRLIGTRSLVRDAAIGLALAGAAWLLFVKVLAVGLP